MFKILKTNVWWVDQPIYKRQFYKSNTQFKNHHSYASTTSVSLSLDKTSSSTYL